MPPYVFVWIFLFEYKFVKYWNWEFKVPVISRWEYLLVLLQAGETTDGLVH